MTGCNLIFAILYVLHCPRTYFPCDVFDLQTINDVLFAVISSGISRYLDFRQPNGKYKRHLNEQIFTASFRFYIRKTMTTVFSL